MCYNCWKKIDTLCAQLTRDLLVIAKFLVTVDVTSFDLLSSQARVVINMTSYGADVTSLSNRPTNT